MKIGTKSLLFGNHQFILHPTLVFIAWVKLYRKLPNWKETICIMIHDWGYWGMSDLDGKEGEDHPIWAAEWASRHFDMTVNGSAIRYWSLCLFHSRCMSKQFNHETSKLCLPDKVSVTLMPIWLLFILGHLSGEMHEYMALTKYEDQGLGPNGASYKSYPDFIRAYRKECQKWVKAGKCSVGVK